MCPARSPLSVVAGKLSHWMIDYEKPSVSSRVAAQKKWSILTEVKQLGSRSD